MDNRPPTIVVEGIPRPGDPGYEPDWWDIRDKGRPMTPGTKYKAEGGILYSDDQSGAWHPADLMDSACKLTNRETEVAVLEMEISRLRGLLDDAGISWRS